MLALAAFVVLLYAALFNRDFTVDGLAYATAVEAGTGLFHPNHLLFAAIHHAIHAAVQALSLAPGRAIWTMQAVTALCGLGTVLALALYLAPRAGARRASLLAALLACSFAFWNFAQEPEAYVPPMFCVALSLALLRDRARAPGTARVALLGALAVLAILLLQQYVLWYPVLLLLLASRLEAGTRRRRVLGWIGAAVPATCLLAYLAIGFAQGRIGDGTALAAWLLGYGFDPEAGIATYRAAPGWFSRSAGFVLGLGNLLFAYETALYPVAIAGAAVVAAILAIGVAPPLARALREATPDARALVLFLVANALFAFWWESRNIEFLLPLAFGTTALAGLGARRAHMGLLGLAVAGLVLVNGACAFWPQRETPARYRDLLALHSVESLGPGDAVIVEELNTTRWLGYFHGIEPHFLPGATSAAMHGDLAIGAARKKLIAALDAGRRVYSFEYGAPGRLRVLAGRFAFLGRAGFEGEVESDRDRLYDGFPVEPVAGMPGVLRVSKPVRPHEREGAGKQDAE